MYASLVILLAVGLPAAGLWANAGAAAASSSDAATTPADSAANRERLDRSIMDVLLLLVRLTRRWTSASRFRRTADGHSPPGRQMPDPTTGRSRAPSRAPPSGDGKGCPSRTGPCRP